MVQGINLVRPLPASSASSILKIPEKPRKPSYSPLLCSGVGVLLILCVCLLAALVLVGRKSADRAVNNNNNNNKDNDIENAIESALNLRGHSDPAGDKSVIVLNKSESRGSDSAEQRRNNSDDDDNNINKKMAQKFASQLTFRLQKEIKPLLYKLELYPNLKTKTFNGSVAIDLEVQEPVSFIAIHSKKLAITNTSLRAGVGSEIPISATYVFDKFEYWVTEFDKPIERGNYTFSMDFAGDLMNRIVGFYGSTYFSPEKNQSRTIATSKFEPTFARQAFPSFDEPNKKAPFEISIIRPTGDDYIALSNMNEVSSVPLGGDLTDLTRTTFNRSVPMSTYLACFIVCDFVKKSAVVDAAGIGQNVELRVFASPSQLHKVDLALKAAKIITEYYIQYFGIEYPLPKLGKKRGLYRVGHRWTADRR